MKKNSSICEQLLGAWTLQSYVETEVDTGTEHHPLGESPLGFIIYTSDGYMSAQLQARDRPLFAGNDMYRGEPSEYVASGSTYLAYSGRFSVDEPSHVVSHHADVSFFPNWFGQTVKRVARFEGDCLMLTTEQPQRFNGTLKMAQLVWKRAIDNS
ncbi:lipocalin-like domain-containing protein [Caballeronia sp. 15715]|uniref:lipocalin-like domain-containing protein n=1 Tax=Caballeronia sp. 15715 TaxID=3391030 RepID=UPI0039E27813